MDACKRPCIPFTNPLFFHMKEDALTLYLDVKWGGKCVCDENHGRTQYSNVPGKGYHISSRSFPWRVSTQKL
eukprot:scaffold386215_cov71-Attheya_sp.AAC.1